MSLSLVVAAPGTRLTAVSGALGALDGFQVLDVEERLKSLLSPADLEDARRRQGPGTGPVQMAAICRAFPRSKVLALWENALRACLSDVDTSGDITTVLTGHLTLYRNDRSEYYSTVGTLIRPLLEGAVQVDNVVLLIDDIFDMHERLVGAAGALNADERRSRWESFTRKVSPETALGGALTEQLELETSVQTLNLLVSWRRHESLSAEALASALGTRLTVLGVKHEWDALQRLLSSSPRARTAYISHPISAYRRTINSQVEAGATPTWDAAVVECNHLPALLAQTGSTVAVMPTAIDEMRFRALTAGATTLVDRAPELGPRWPLIARGIDLISGARSLDFSDADVQHADILTRTHPSLFGSEVPGELTRFIEGLFFIEIPYRDHLLVANCDDLVVFRPLADHGRLSSGVEHEVHHWWDRVKHGDSRTRLVVVHKTEDFELLRSTWEGTASWLSSDRQLASIRSAVEDVATLSIKALTDNHDLQPAEARRILRGQALQADQLGGHTELGTRSAAIAVRDESIAAAVDEFIRRAIGITRGRDSGQALIVILDEGVSLSSRRAAAINEFLDADQVSSSNTQLTVIGDEDASVRTSRLIESDYILERLFNVDVRSLLRERGVTAPGGTEQSERKTIAIQAAVTWLQGLVNAVGGNEDLPVLETPRDSDDLESIAAG